jgi:hypothetical protein
MNIKRFSLHKFNNIDNLTFSKEDYSKLKFGDNSVAKKYGEELAQSFFDNNLDVILLNKIVVYESSYNFVRNASSLITDAFFNHLCHLTRNYNATLYRGKINRIIPYTTDYGKLDLKERTKLLKKDTFTFDHKFSKDKFNIFIDDVFISGVHHRKIEEMIKNYKIDFDRCLCLYYGEYTGDCGFDIESKLNFAFIKDLNVLDSLIKTTDDYKIIVRTLKMILNEEYGLNNNFLENQDLDFLRKLYYFAIGEGYHKVPAYNGQLSKIYELLFINKLD